MARRKRSLDKYRAGIRQLRDAGVKGFESSRGYKLTGKLLARQKQVITGAVRELGNRAAEFYAESAGDEYEEFDDLDFMDLDADLIADFYEEYNDAYEEGAEQ